MKKVLLGGALVLIGGIGFFYLGGIRVIRRLWTRGIVPFTWELNKITQSRIQQGFNGRLAFVLSVPPGATFILVSGIAGNSNSLKLIIEELQNKGLLSHDMNLINDRTYLVCAGNMSGTPPYNEEVLGTIVRLMKANPSTMFYLLGPQEWQLVGDSVDPSIAQYDTIRRFFATLPLGLYLFAEDDKKAPVRLAAYGAIKEFERVSCRSVTRGNIRAICRLGDLCSFEEGPLGTFIDGETKDITWSTMKGLQRSEQAWHVLSSPRLEYQQGYRFLYTSYTVIHIAGSLAESTITYSYSKEGSDGFVQGDQYNLITGAKL